MLKMTKKTKGQRRPGKPEVSPTKIKTYLSCPLMYKFVYVTRIGRLYYCPNVGDSFGGSIHRALQSFHAAGGHETQDSEQLTARLKDVWTGMGYSSREEENEHLEFGARLLEDYYQNSRTGNVTLFTERRLRYDMGDFALIGQIDRLDERPDGVLDIVDYKTGRITVAEDEVSSDLAMCIYQLLVRKAYPGRDAVATIYCLRSGQSASAKLSDEELVELEEMIRSTVEDLLKITEDTDIPPVRRDVCDQCNFFKICERRARSLGEEWAARSE